MTRFARCCEPLPGEKIVGYITQGRGITIHAANCPGLKKLGAERKVPVMWEADDNPAYPVRIVFEGIQMARLTQDINRVLMDHGVVVVSEHIQVTDRKQMRVRGVLMVEAGSIKNMDNCYGIVKKDSWYSKNHPVPITKEVTDFREANRRRMRVISAIGLGLRHARLYRQTDNPCRYRSVFSSH